MQEPPTLTPSTIAACYYRLRVPRLVPESPDMRREAVRELIAFLEPIPPPAPRFSDFGLALMSLHFGMCRSAAVALKVRPQCGQGTKSGSGVDDRWYRAQVLALLDCFLYLPIRLHRVAECARL